MAKVYISLGTNLGDKEQNLHSALNLIKAHCGSIEQKSSIYSSAPWGFVSFNNFLNQVVLIESALKPESLIKKLVEIENELGRKRTSTTYQDRIIDIDILFYNKEIICIKHLQIPHPRLHERNFILQPLLEIDGNFIHPVLNKSILELANSAKDPIKAFKK